MQRTGVEIRSEEETTLRVIANAHVARRAMAKTISPGDCVKLPDGRTARVRDITGDVCRVRVRRETGRSNQFLTFHTEELEKVSCPKGWMSPEGYNSYLEITLAKMRKRARR